MSLISLSSSSRSSEARENQSNFSNFFPQPIMIKPHSQVCLTSFYHFRDNARYSVNQSNDKLVFGFGDRNFDVPMVAILSRGAYVGADFAFEVARAMNKANLQQNYTWSCTFTPGTVGGGGLSEFDEFVISYDDASPADTTGGEWSFLDNTTKLADQNTLTNNTAAETTSSLLNQGDKTNFPIILRDGVLLYDGYVRYENISTSNEVTAATQQSLANLDMGLICDSMTSNVGVGSSDAFGFNANFGNILVQTRDTNPGVAAADAGNSIAISTLEPVQGEDPYAASNAGKKQVNRRLIDNANMILLMNDGERFAIEIHRNAPQRAWVVKIQKSTDDGESYDDLSDGEGSAVAKDGRPAVYSQTIGGVSYTSLIYSSVGINDVSGNPIPASQSLNAARNTLAPFIPFVNMVGQMSILDGFLFDDTTFQVDTGQGSPALVADNQFIMVFGQDESGNGYDFIMETDTAEVTSSTQCNSSQFDGFAIGGSYLDGAVQTYSVYSDNLTPIADATEIGTMEIRPGEGVGGFLQLSFVGLDGSEPISINPAIFSVTDVDPEIKNQNTALTLQGKYNPAYHPRTTISGQPIDSVEGFTRIGQSFDVDFWDGTTYGEDTASGSSFPQESYLVLSRPSVAAKYNARAAPVFAQGSPELNAGTTGGLLGFTDAIVSKDSGTKTYTRDTKPQTNSSDGALHISIPELTGVRSYEGEAETTAKTIKVLPKNIFWEDNANGSLTYSADYEEWIDISNAEPLSLNEMTVQCRNPDQRLATNLQTITRATIKIREDPEQKRMQEQRELFTLMSQMRTQGQSTSAPVLVNNSSFLGS